MNLFIGGRTFAAAAMLAGGLGVQQVDAGVVFTDGIVYVDQSVATSGDGSTWSSALKRLTDAIIMASNPRNNITQVWVADGNYRPAGVNGDRTVSFNLRNDLAIYGGFVGGEKSIDDRNPAANFTILSGDLASNDAGFVNNGENSFHVVRALNVNSTAVLDGFTIVGGNANGSSPNERGGGMWLTNATPTIVNCTFLLNSAAFGGGMYCEAGSSITVNRCTWSSNRATHSGGAIYAHVSSPTIVNGVFFRNEATVSASVLRNQTSADTTLVNCTIAQSNVLTAAGGAIFNFNSAATIRNVIMVDSFSPGTHQAIINGTGGAADVTHSAIPNTPGTGNINPPAVLFDNPSPGNFRLLPGSPCIDAGDNLAVPDGVSTDVYDNNRFANDPAMADVGVPNGLNALVDMGAVERIPVDFNGDGVVNGIDLGQLLSGWGNPACAGASPCPVDLDLNGVVDGLDLGFLIFFWTH